MLHGLVRWAQRLTRSVREWMVNRCEPVATAWLPHHVRHLGPNSRFLEREKTTARVTILQPFTVPRPLERTATMWIVDCFAPLLAKTCCTCESATQNAELRFAQRKQTATLLVMMMSLRFSLLLHVPW